jgi:Amt family ammonium transporter
MCYQGTFAIITAALISGAIVERMRFSAYVVFITLWSVIVYSPIAHWVWGGGWLAQMGTYSGVMSFVLLKVVSLVVPLRTGRDDEGVGMDVSQHGEEAYVHAEGATVGVWDGA